MNKCKICSSEYREQIDSLLDSGEFKKSIAQQFNVSYPSLVRHAARHGKNAPVPAAEISDLAKEAETWRIRANQVWEQSVADGDTRGQTQSLAVALRGLELAYKQAERDAQTKPQTDGRPCTLDEIDAIVRNTLGDKRCALIDKLFAASPDTLATVESILAERVN